MSYLHYLCYLCLFTHSGVQHILCCVFVLFFFVLFPVSLDCPYLIAPLVFFSVYLRVLALSLCLIVVLCMESSLFWHGVDGCVVL